MMMTKQHPRKKVYNNNYSSKTKFKCHYCHEKGHFQRNCPKKKDDEKMGRSSMICVQNDNEVYFLEFALQIGEVDGVYDWWLSSGCSSAYDITQEGLE